MDPYAGIVQTWRAQDEEAPKKQHHTARLIYDRLVEEHGFRGGESTVRRYVRQLRGQEREVYIPLAADWGEQAQVDWGRAKAIAGGRFTEVCLFALRMRASKAPFGQAFPTERLEAFLEGHRRALAWLGGVPREVAYDNPKTAVVKILAGPAREEHRFFSSLRAHYLFYRIFCRPGEAHEKGAVENLVGYVRRNVLVPMPDVPDLAALNARLLAWCEAQRARPRDAGEKQHAALRPLPAHPFRCSLTRMVKVNGYSLVTYDRVRYSVPGAHVGQTLRLEAFSDRVEVWHRHRLVAQHRRSYNRQDTVLELDHYLEALAQKPRAVTHAAVVRRPSRVFGQARAWLCNARRDGYREFGAILMLGREFPWPEVAAAIEIALAKGLLAVVTVRQLQRRRRAARFPWLKSLGDFAFTAISKLPKAKVLTLADGGFIRNRATVQPCFVSGIPARGKAT